LLDRIARWGMRLTGADSARVWMPSAEGGEIFELAIYYAGGESYPAGRRIEKGSSATLAGPMPASGRARRVQPGDPGPERLLEGERLEAGLLVPIVIQGAIAGVLTLTHTQPRATFTDEDLNTARLFAAQAASAISGFRQLAETQAELTRRQQAEQEIMRRNE